MTITTKARYVNGTPVPLQPLDLPEGAIVSVSVDADEASTAEPDPRQLPFKVVPLVIGYAPGVNDENLKDIIYELEEAEFLEKLGL